MFEPKRLKKSVVDQVFGEYLRSMQAEQLKEHLQELVNQHAPEGRLEMDDHQALAEKIEAERDRLLLLAEEDD